MRPSSVSRHLRSIQKLASILIVIILTGTLVNCGHSSKSTAPAPAAVEGPQNQQQARDVAQQSAAVATSLVGQVKSLINVARLHGSEPARVEPLHGLQVAADSTRWTYSFQGYDLNGNPIDWVSQNAQLASLVMDYHFYINSSSDSLQLREDFGSHTRVDGLDSLATQYVCNASDTTALNEDYTGANIHYLLDYHGLTHLTNVAWAKSGTPSYPIAGSMTIHWLYAYDYTSGSTHQAYSGEVDATITFNGTQFAVVRIGSYTFSVDLVSGAVS